MIDAYLDESGIHAGAFACVIAGYFGGRGQWRKFEKDWRAALTRAGLPLDKFHATEITRMRSRRSLLNELVDVIGRYKITPVSRAVIVDDFNSFSETQRRFLTGARLLNGRLVTSGCPNRPYFLPFSTCLKQVLSYAPVGGKAHFFFGLDRPFFKYASASFAALKNNGHHQFQDRMGDVAAPIAKETPQLQAADLLALLTFRHIEEVRKTGDWKIKNPLLEACLVRTQMPEDHAFHNQEVIQDSLEMTYKYSGDGTGLKRKMNFRIRDNGFTIKGKMKPEPAPSEPGDSDAARMDNALRKVLAISKADLLKAEAEWKRKRARRKRAKTKKV